MQAIQAPYYLADEVKMYKETKDGMAQLTNFNAWIEKELIYHDGDKTTTHLYIRGAMTDAKTGEKVALPQVQIPASDFKSLGWVAEKWGMKPIIYPVSSAERDIVAFIQLQSSPERQHIYTHTGWTEIEGTPTYLTTTGGIHVGGLDAAIAVQLPHELQRFQLPAPTNDYEPFAESIRLVNLGPKQTTWTLLLATYRAAMGAADFAVHLAGRTGTFKSEISSLFQSHFGPGMDARHLPASWSATANALEALAYRAMNALMVVDDFVPVGTAWQVRTLQAKADQFIRGQGNQSGRARLNDTTSLQQTFYPRGIVLSTGEDIPEGHSVRGRMMIVELAPGEIATDKLTAAQQHRPAYAQAMANWIHWLSTQDVQPELQRCRQVWRDRALGIGHTRTASIVGDLMATMTILMQWADSMGWLNSQMQQSLIAKAEAAIMDAAQRQGEYLHSADPVEALCETIRQLLGANLAHLKTRGGGVPDNATLYGWTEEKTPGEMPTYKAHGPRLGWVCEEEETIFLDPASLTLLKRHSGGKLAITPQTLLKRCVEAGVINRTDASRQRNTVRVNLEQHQRNVLSLDRNRVMDEVK